MSLSSWLRSLMTFTDDPWASVKAWRKRRAEVVKPSRPTFDAYPDAAEPPALNLYIEARDARGRLRRQLVDLSGYSLHQVNLSSDRWRRDLIGRIADARYELLVKLSEVADAKE